MYLSIDCLIKTLIMIHIFKNMEIVLRIKLNQLKFLIIFSIILIFSISFYGGKIYGEYKTKDIKETLIEEILYVTEPEIQFSEENLRDYLEQLNIKYPHIVYAQAIQETGHFTSDIFKENNNLFGMKIARQRPTTALGTRRNHAYYRNWMDSVKDYALYQAAYLGHIKTEEDYLKFIGNSYAEDENYINRVKYIISNNQLAMLFKY